LKLLYIIAIEPFLRESLDITGLKRSHYIVTHLLTGKGFSKSKRPTGYYESIGGVI
jgi:hypothetical protein